MFLGSLNTLSVCRIRPQISRGASHEGRVSLFKTPDPGGRAKILSRPECSFMESQMLAVFVPVQLNKYDDLVILVVNPRNPIIKKNNIQCR